MHCSAPGKLFITGEWSVLEGNPGIVAAVNKRVHSVVEKNDDDILISIDDFGIKDLKCNFDGKRLLFSENVVKVKDRLQFIKESTETALRYISENGMKLKPFKIRTWGEETNIMVNNEQKKIGFGSSAASTVAVIASVLAFHGYDAEKEEIYKLAAVAHYFAQGKDVAASTYGGLFVYKRFDPQWLTNRVERGERIKDIVRDEWPGLCIEELEIPDDLILLIGWTRKSASTSAMVRQMNDYKRNSPEEYGELIRAIAGIAAEAIEAFKKGDRGKFLSLIRKNEEALAELGGKSGVNIETPELKKLSETANRYGGAGKLSGAGGGDCGIAVCFDKKTAEKITEEWKKAGIRIVDADIDKNGVITEK
jgi:phosphomevalonate kinase